MNFKKDYYKILEIDRKASKEEIRASYRRLAKLHHPDKNLEKGESEEKFKEINEAYEIISNDILRHEYDQYQKMEEEWKENQRKGNQGEAVSWSNKKKYQKKTTVATETRIYIRGEVVIKYWGEPEDEKMGIWLGEIKYKIQPKDIRVKIEETDIHPIQGVPLEYLKAFKESDLFKSPVTQPVKCSIKTSEGEEHYNLELKDFRIRNIRLEGVTKYEKQTLGTLRGEIFAYTPKFDYHEEVEEVTECFGETGRVESKLEGEVKFYRKEYYQPDCATYWGEWQAIRKPAQTTYRKKEPVLAEAAGCLQWWWVPVLLIFMLAVPQFFVAALAVFSIYFILYLLGAVLSSLGRALPFLGFLFFSLFLVSAIRSFSAGQQKFIKHDTPRYDSIHTSHALIVRNEKTGDSTREVPDTLISHFIRWKDYDSLAYEAHLAIAASDLRTSVERHDGMDPYFGIYGFSSIYTSMLQSDANKLHYIYQAFDSIRKANQLDDLRFAKMIMSCVQSVPYYLVVDKSCNDQYNDDFTNDYLATCNRDCCIGNEKFGVRTPVEFISDLKGDCDTRALFMYKILKHYNYNVALLTSRYYKHALIAVHVQGAEGLAKNIHNRNYYLWETTSAGLNLGVIPTYLQNLDYWEITLLNEIN